MAAYCGQRSGRIPSLDAAKSPAADDGHLAAVQVGFGRPALWGDNTQQAYWPVESGVKVIWCLSIARLFSEIFLVKRAFPAQFDAVPGAHPYVLYASGLIGMLASVLGAFITFRSPWTPLFGSGSWRPWLASRCGVTALTAIKLYTVREVAHRHQSARREPAQEMVLHT